MQEITAQETTAQESEMNRGIHSRKLAMLQPRTSKSQASENATEKAAKGPASRSALPTGDATGKDSSSKKDSKGIQVESLKSQDAPEVPPVVALPELGEGKPSEIWLKYFEAHQPAPSQVASWIQQLNEKRDHQQIIGLIQASLSQGQSQPWMYEVLALSMDIEGYPKTDVERALLSLSDFGASDFNTIVASGAYLTRLGQPQAALKLYKLGSQLEPERPEPYSLSLRLAKDQKSPDDVIWAATGLLQYYWGRDYNVKHREAVNAINEQIRLATNQNNTELVAKLQAALQAARLYDLQIRVEWNGSADLDLQVEEPGGGICSVIAPRSAGGGIFVHDGYGPDRKAAYEYYVAPRAFPGTYRLLVKKQQGTLTGHRATITFLIAEGTPEQSKFVRTLSFEDKDEEGVTIDLAQGRRLHPRIVPNDQ